MKKFFSEYKELLATFLILTTPIIGNLFKSFTLSMLFSLLYLFLGSILIIKMSYSTKNKNHIGGHSFMSFVTFKPKYNLLFAPLFGLFPISMILGVEKLNQIHLVIFIITIFIMLGLFAAIYSKHIILQITPEGIFEKKLFQKKCILKFAFKNFKSSEIFMNQTDQSLKQIIRLVNDSQEYIINLTNYEEKILDELSKHIELTHDLENMHSTQRNLKKY